MCKLSKNKQDNTRTQRTDCITWRINEVKHPRFAISLRVNSVNGALQPMGDL